METYVSSAGFKATYIKERTPIAGFLIGQIAFGLEYALIRSAVTLAAADFFRPHAFDRKRPPHVCDGLFSIVYKAGVAPCPDTQIDYSMILETTPAPTVRPPSRIAKRRPSS
ncbi:MAG: hypothetical protein ABJG80_21585, partial [Paracoccaceae bacterium]